ncbi:PREDICTED: uncharacterized protein LOC104777410 [Camelina sativa]|uniref:Uncharacterized protein LOC104777410 n=1 Tax=Camelina sativa TaxID=90675 RepID=A0ABM0YF17_CAMSA|nr:PREDICTED: uncharacterized protein LOC104777410 [Camelina sativa]
MDYFIKAPCIGSFRQVKFHGSITMVCTATSLTMYDWLKDCLKKLKSEHGKVQVGNITVDMKWNLASGRCPLEELLSELEETIAAPKEPDALLLGAIGEYKWDNNEKHMRPEKGLIQLHEVSNRSSFIKSGVLPFVKRYKMKFLVLLIVFPIMVILLCFCFALISHFKIGDGNNSSTNSFNLFYMELFMI